MTQIQNWHTHGPYLNKTEKLFENRSDIETTALTRLVGTFGLNPTGLNAR